MLNKPINPVEEEDTINKSILLNWLYLANKNLSILELGKWIEARTQGKYTLVKDQDDITLSITENANNKVHN